MVEDDRFDYGEVRFYAVGYIGNRLHTLIYADGTNEHAIRRSVSGLPHVARRSDMKPKYDPAVHGDPPPLTDEMLGKMRSARQVHGDDWVDRAMGRKRGRPKSAAPKVEVKIRLDAATVEHLRHSGPGWQTRVNALLGKLVAAGQI